MCFGEKSLKRELFLSLIDLLHDGISRSNTIAAEGKWKNPLHEFSRCCRMRRTSRFCLAHDVVVQ